MTDAVAVPVEEDRAVHFGSVRRTPDDLGARLAVVFLAGVAAVAVTFGNAASECHAVDVKAAQDLRSLTDVAECVREVADVGNLAVFGGNLLPDEHVAHVGFAVNKVFVLQDVPRAGDKTSFGNVLFDLFAHLRTYGEVVLDDNRLTVEMEAPERRVGVEGIQQTVEKFHQLEAVRFERHVPFTVPVRMGDKVKMFLFV